MKDDMGATGFAFVTVNIDRNLEIPQMTQATMETTIFETHTVGDSVGLPVPVSDADSSVSALDVFQSFGLYVSYNTTGLI